MRKAIAIFLLMVSPLWAAPGTVYVCADGNNSDGLDWAKAKTTIAAGLALSATYDPLIVRVAPGNYAEAGTSGRIQISSTQNGKTVTLLKYPGDDGTGTTKADGAVTMTAATTYTLWARGSWTSGTVTFDAINFNNGANNSQVVWDPMSGSASTAKLVLQNLALTTGGTYNIFLDGADQPLRNLTLSGVTFTCNAGYWFGGNSWNRLLVTGCTGTRDSSALQGPMFAMGVTGTPAFTEAIFLASTFTVDAYHASRPLIGDNAIATSGTVIFDGNTVDSKTNVIRMSGSTTGTGVRVIARNNTITVRPTAFNQSVSAFVIGDESDNGRYLQPPVITGNVMTCTSNAAGHSNAVFLGTACLGGCVAYNKARGFDQSFYAQGRYGTFVGNDADGADAYIVETGLWGGTTFTGLGNVYIANSGYAGSSHPTTGNAGVICLRDGVGPTYQPLANVFLHNAVQASDNGTNCVVLDNHTTGSMTVSSNIFDWNVYWLDGSGSGGLFLIDSTQSDSRAPLAFPAWSTYLHGSQYNDLHSVIANPQFRSLATGDLRLQRSSPARGTRSGTGLLPEAWATKGAYEVDQGTGSGGADLGTGKVGF